MEGKEKMSLRLWMPLMGDLRNQGLDNFSMSTLGTISWVDGKLGAKALQAGNANQTSNGISINSNLTDILADEYSVSVWIKPLGNHVHYNGTILSSGNWNHTCWAFGVSQNNTKVDVLSNRYNVYLNCTIPVNEWTHLICTCDSSNKVHLYKNGEYIGYTTRSDKPLSDASNATIGRETYANGYFSFNGAIQDLRLYDHCLSEMEIKQLSQGLILHYPLNRQGFGQENLLKNTNDLTKWNKESGISVEWDESESMYKVFTTIRESSRWGIYQDYAITVDTDTNYTFSLTGKTDGFSAYLSFGAGTSWPSNYIAFTTTKQRLSKTVTIPAGTTNIRVYLAMYPKTGGGHVYFEKPKLEKGSIATPWCPNSSDVLATTMGLNGMVEYDTSGYCNNGTWHGTHTNTSDTPKYAVSTTATGSASTYLEGPILPAEVQTAALWIKCKKSQNAAIFNNKTTGLQIGLLNSLLYMNSKTSTAGFTTTHWKDDEWNHVVVTYDGTTRKAYINGEAETQSGASNYYIHNADNCWLWNRSYNNSYPFNGSLSDFRIYATALSASDVKSLYQNCATIDPDGTIRGQIRS